MSTSDHTPYDSGQTSENPPTEQGNALKYCLGGCLIMLVLGLVGVFVGGYLIYVNGKAIAVNAVKGSMVAVVDDLQLSDADKKEINKQIERVAEDYKKGNITLEQVGQVAEELGESPLMQIGMVYFIEQNYLVNSGLSEEEKAEGRLSLQRAARGVYEKRISEEYLEAAMAPMMKEMPDGQKQLKEQVTDEELRQFLTNLKHIADDADIPEEEFKVNIGEEFRKAVDRVYEMQP